MKTFIQGHGRRRKKKLVFFRLACHWPQTFWVKFSGKTPLAEISLFCTQWDSFTPISQPSSCTQTPSVKMFPCENFQLVTLIREAVTEPTIHIPQMLMEFSSACCHLGWTKWAYRGLNSHCSFSTDWGGHISTVSCGLPKQGPLPLFAKSHLTGCGLYLTHREANCS